MKKALIIMFLVFSLLPLLSVYHKLGDFITQGTGFSIAIVDSIAYIAEGNSGIQIIDVSDPQNPTLMSSYPTQQSANFIRVIGDVAYITCYDYGLKILNVSNPFSPALLGEYDSPGQAKSVCVVNNIAYIADGYSGLLMLDVSDPLDITLLGTYVTSGSVNSVQVVGDLAYLGKENHDGFLQIVNVSNPQNPIFLGSYSSLLSTGNETSVAIDGNYAYLTLGTEFVPINISDPQNPTAGWIPNTWGNINYITSQDGFIYATNDYQGLYVKNINSGQIYYYDTFGQTLSVAIVNEIAYLVGNSGLQIIDISNANNSSLIGSAYNFYYAQSIVVKYDASWGEIAFIINSAFLSTFSVSNPQNPTQLGTRVFPSWANSVSVNGNTAYVAATSSGLQVVDISDLTNPIIAGSYDTPGSALSIAVVGNIAYVADDDYGLQIINVANPNEPMLFHSYDTPGNATFISVVDYVAYIADGNSGLQIINVANPENPVPLGSYDTPGNAACVQIVGNIAYVADGSNGLLVLDISNPVVPVLLHTYNLHPSSYIGYCYKFDNRLYVPDDYWNEINVFDINIPQSPVLVNRYSWNLETDGMCIDNNLLYTANGRYGMNIHDITTFPISGDDSVQYPEMPSLLKNFPNPFKSATIISFEVKEACKTIIDVYNVKGQIVRTLINETKSIGNHKVVWDGKDKLGRSLATGIYFINMKAGSYSTTKKVILIR